MFQQEESKSKATEEVEKMAESTPMSAGDPVVGAAVLSVFYSWYRFYVKGEKESGIFVGLWAPTLLAAAGYMQQKDIVRKFKRGLASF